VAAFGDDENRIANAFGDQEGAEYLGDGAFGEEKGCREGEVYGEEEYLEAGHGYFGWFPLGAWEPALKMLV
jgi:hypothetical protein